MLRGGCLRTPEALFDGVNAIKYFGGGCTFMLADQVSRAAIGDVEVKVVFGWTLAPVEPNGAPFLGSTTSAVHHASCQLGLISLLCRAVLTLQNR